MSDDAIFEESLKCLRLHLHLEWGDRTLLDVFSRLLAKHIRPGGWTPNKRMDIGKDHFTSRKEYWTTEALGKLARGHASTAGKDFGCPIIIAEYGGVQRVLDGNHRINRWIATGDNRVHEVNIHVVSTSGVFVDLPSVT